jgi:hypothetical protein
MLFSSHQIRLLPTISIASSLVELAIKDEVPAHEDLMGLASFSRLQLPRLQSFALHLPRMAINKDRAWWDLASLLRLSVHVGCYVTR